MLKKLQKVREDEIKRIKKADEGKEAEERKAKSDKEKKERRDALLKGMSASDQMKFLEKERKQEMRKGQKKISTRG